MDLVVRSGSWKRRAGRFEERRFGSRFSGGSAPEVRTPMGAYGPDPN